METYTKKIILLNFIMYGSKEVITLFDRQKS